jgi:hypothetical protein
MDIADQTDGQSQEERRADENAAIALRYLLWMRHGCSVAALYGDDGEMQCGACGIDFKRDGPGRISERFRQIGIEKFSESLERVHGD